MCPTCALSYAARVGFRSNDSDPRHAQGESARVRPLLRPAATSEGRVLSSAHCPHCQTRRFSRGVILIGALSKVLRLPLLQESGRLRQNLCSSKVKLSLSPSDERQSDFCGPQQGYGSKWTLQARLIPECKLPFASFPPSFLSSFAAFFLPSFLPPRPAFTAYYKSIRREACIRFGCLGSKIKQSHPKSQSQSPASSVSTNRGPAARCW